MGELLSPLKTIEHRPTGRMFKMGRTTPPPQSERMMFLPADRYLDARAPSLPPRPKATHYADLAKACLAQVLMNDRLGCCTIAGMFHTLGVFLSNSGQPMSVIPNSLVEAVYRRSGYVSGRPDTDRGWDEIAALESWKSNGIGIGRPIAGWLNVDPTNVEQMKHLIWLFENLYFGMSMPDAWVGADMPSRDGFRWKRSGAADEENGHCFIAMDYDDATSGPGIDTWGMRGVLDWDAIAEYGRPENGGEVHCVISTDALVKATKKAPSGVDWPTMVADFNARGGNVDPLRHLIP